ncbi:hypothetical protein AAC387_Pa07g1436 [Persea americana]
MAGRASSSPAMQDAVAIGEPKCGSGESFFPFLALFFSSVQILCNRDSKSEICNLCGRSGDRLSAASRKTPENREDKRFTFDSPFRCRKRNLEHNFPLCKTRNKGSSVCHKSNPDPLFSDFR